MIEPGNDKLKMQKAGFRRRGLAARGSVSDTGVASRRIVAKIRGMESFCASMTVMCYVPVREEVETLELLGDVLRAGKRLVVPYCVDHELGLFRLESLDELEPGLMGIPEPRKELRELPGKMVAAKELDLVLVPGIAFDRRGERVGYGKGYYDRLLARVRGDAMKIGLAFECQMEEVLPTEPHDVQMDAVVTESGVYDCIANRTNG